jgi:hypothetical protein
MDSRTKGNAGFEFDSSQNGFEHFVVPNSLPKGKPRIFMLLCGGFPSGMIPEFFGNASMMVVETQHAASLP